MIIVMNTNVSAAARATSLRKERNLRIGCGLRVCIPSYDSLYVKCPRECCGRSGCQVMAYENGGDGGGRA